MRQKGVGSKQPGPFVVGSLCCAVWLKYGLLVDNESVWRTNALGLALHLGYTACYAAYASIPARRAVLKVAATMTAALATFAYYLSTLHARKCLEHHADASNNLNRLCVRSRLSIADRTCVVLEQDRRTLNPQTSCCLHCSS